MPSRRHRLFALALAALLPACADSKDDGPTPFDDDNGPGADVVNDGAPDNNSLPDDNKADAIYPAKFEVADQSAVKSQGSRGICSIFASTAMIENLYIHAGMPAADADFSEQYLQWAAKNLGGQFKNTEGSSSDANLSTVVKYGTIKESDWRYETFPWSAANDPECAGAENEKDNLPTKCYTNGEPPATVSMAAKFKLPSSRWINTNSIKANITTKKVGVNIGLTFFYQAWNHRHSTIPVNSEYWRKGYVTYPNETDKTESLKQRAGHAIHIVGWDDDLEVCMRDGEGHDVPDGAGGCKKEKGFWIFKNSWGTVGFGILHPTGPGYGYLSYKYVAEYGSAVIADVPSLDNPPPPPTGGTAHTYNATPAAAIPDNAPAGVTNTIDVTDDGKVSEAKVTVDITHSYRGDLQVTLVKGTKSIVLFNGDGGSADDLKQTFTVTGIAGEALRGGWSLKVVDTAAQDTGTLNSWKLEATAAP